MHKTDELILLIALFPQVSIPLQICSLWPRYIVCPLRLDPCSGAIDADSKAANYSQTPRSVYQKAWATAGSGI
jgi:hypothetical protein